MPIANYIVTYDDDSTEVVKLGRPGALIAFADEFGKQTPDDDSPKVMYEVAWLVHRSARIAEPFAEWVERVASIDPESNPVATTAAVDLATAAAELSVDVQAGIESGADPTQLLAVDSPPTWPERPHRPIDPGVFASSSPA